MNLFRRDQFKLDSQTKILKIYFGENKQLVPVKLELFGTIVQFQVEKGLSSGEFRVETSRGTRFEIFYYCLILI